MSPHPDSDPNRAAPSHALTWWMLVLFAVPVLYLVLLPPFFLVGAELGMWNIFPPPPWLEALIVPYVWLDDHTPLHVPLSAYVDWWFDIVGVVLP